VTKTLTEAGIVRELADQVALRLTRKAIALLQRTTDTLSADDSGLETVWDEICVQLQYDYSYYWDVYDMQVRDWVHVDVAELRPHELEAIWLQTEAGCDWASEEDRGEEYPVSQQDITDFIVNDYIYQKARKWTNSRIRNYLENFS
jgi:hypothetical protein